LVIDYKANISGTESQISLIIKVSERLLNMYDKGRNPLGELVGLGNKLPTRVSN